ncbi:APC family permease [Actinokineospora bangkokensis]|uniref:Amino acid transporter n=1 Tax=Actinokineospora bangkokensis TaxID=1193682 RepID=A0A1Q9LIP7_9PSEU|nr:APC family permease [Actinokineospora bangkokensis]OLR91893.1 amino acid transporter [Actinokineospora bangkokensis]
MTTTDSVRPLPGQDDKLRRELGYWSLTGIAFGGIIGSGWLFGSFYGAQAAGPAAVLSWVIGGCALGLVALVLIELGSGTPQAGGLVRWPSLANGPLAGTLVGWAMLLAVASTMAAQASAITQYADRYLPGLYVDGALTPLGKVAGAGLLLVLVALNWFGVKLFARLNLLVTAIKVTIPVLTVVALVLSGLHPENVAAGGGFAPFGWPAVLTAIASAGIIYGLDGFAAPIDLSGEARNARRDIPRAVLTAICLSMLLHVVLQLTFVFVVPTDSLAGGWQGIDFSSPFGELALLLNLSWLATIIYADAVFSPSGSTYVIVAAGSRETYAVAKNKALPRRFGRVSERAGVPRNAMALNYVLAVLFLLPSSGWQQIIGVVGVLAVLTYALCTVAAASFRLAAPHRLAGWVRGLGWIAPAGFVVGSELIYWGSWQNLRIALPLLAASTLLFAALRRRDLDIRRELRTGAWLVCYLAWLLLVSALGTFGGSNLIPAPWDTVLVAALALLTHRWGARSGAAFLRRQDEPTGA